MTWWQKHLVRFIDVWWRGIAIALILLGFVIGLHNPASPCPYLIIGLGVLMWRVELYVKVVEA